MSRTEVDGHRLMYHPGRVQDWLDGKAVYPIYVEIGPTNRCNHRCAFCALDWMKHGGSDIDPKVMLCLLGDMAACGVKSVMFAGEGEPLMHPNIAEFIQTARHTGMDVAMTTNGALFDDKKVRTCLPCLSWVRISLDAGTPATYAELHGVSAREFEKTLDNIAAAADMKKQLALDTTIGVQVLMLPQNVDEWPGITRRIKEIGADNIQFKPYSWHPLSQNSFAVDYARLAGMEEQLLAFQDERFQVYYRKSTIDRITGGRDYPECYGLPFFALVDSRANIIPCNMYYNNPDYTYGNLYESTFSEIWQSERRRTVIQRIACDGVGICRRGCRLDAVNRYLHQLNNPHPHVNFI